MGPLAAALQQQPPLISGAADGPADSAVLSPDTVADAPAQINMAPSPPPTGRTPRVIRAGRCRPGARPGHRAGRGSRACTRTVSGADAALPWSSRSPD
ncbi:hypothetical protein NKH18_15105 [Streptomyces sp. M10(2022)]